MCTFVFIVLAVIMFIIALTLARSASLEPPKPPGMQDEFRLTWPEIVAELRLRLGKPDHVLDPGGLGVDRRVGLLGVGAAGGAAGRRGRTDPERHR